MEKAYEHKGCYSTYDICVDLVHQAMAELKSGFEESRERSLAMTKLEEAVMWMTAAYDNE